MTPPSRHTESNAWLLVKHAAHLGLVAAVASFVIAGGDQPFFTIGAATTALVVLVIVAAQDRQRFAESGTELPDHAVVDVVGQSMWVAMPMATPVAASTTWHMPRPNTPMVADVVSVTGLAPLVADMSVALREPVDVT